MIQNEEYDLIQRIHINYINYRLLRKQKKVLEIIDFKDYLLHFYRINYNYYLELCEKYNFDLTR